MSVVYWFTITIAGIFIWKMFSILVFPLLRVFMPFIFPTLWNYTSERPGIKQVKDLSKFVYTQFLMRVLLILWCVAVFFLGVIYFIYFVAKYILLKQVITASIGKSILELPVIKEFIDFGVFPFFDNILAHRFPTLFDGPPGPIGTAVLNFSSSFIKKIKSEDKEEKKPVVKNETKRVNPNLTDEENNAANEKIEKCIKDNTPEAYKGTDQIKLLSHQLNSTKAKIMCDVQQIMDAGKQKKPK